MICSRNWYSGYCFQGRHHFGQAYWGRGNSWFTACAVDFAEWIPDGPVRRLILNTWQEQCKALLSVQDPESGLWHTLLDQPDSYLETSASAAIAYGLLKGSRLGLLDEDCRAAGEKALPVSYTHLWSFCRKRGQWAGPCTGAPAQPPADRRCSPPPPRQAAPCSAPRRSRRLNS